MSDDTVRVFNINKAVGYASSGVEYAQRYRRQLLADVPSIDDLYVFTDYMATNPTVFTDRLGFARSQVLWIYNVLSGRDARPLSLGVDDILAQLGLPPQSAPPQTDVVEVSLPGSRVRHRIRTVASGHVDRVETLLGDRVIRIEHYDETLGNVEHFHENKLVRRVFHAPDGAVAAEQHYRGGEITRTRVTPVSPLYRRPRRRGRGSTFTGDILLDGRAQFLRFVFDHLLSRPDDVVIVDRALDVIDALYPVIGERRLYSVVHAEHYDPKRAEDGILLWNNHYEHVFTRPDMVDAYVVSTARQKEMLERQLASRFPEGAFTVTCIPVGWVAPRPAQTSYDPLALVTASRLADEKHIDLLIRAVALARRSLPGLRLDVFGEGRRDGLREVIEQTGTADCVRLRGHHRLEGVLGTYALYVSASTSEGFGLSLLEAIAEGLPVVGFDVDYGNREMVEQGVNGRLVPRTDDHRDEAALAEAIVEILTAGRLDDMRRESLRKAEEYGASRIRALWAGLLQGSEA